jgi:putative transcription factor
MFRILAFLLAELRVIRWVQARLDKKMTQAQLSQLINEKPQIVQEYESGKAIPNQQIIMKLERVLGVKLRGQALKK